MENTIYKMLPNILTMSRIVIIPILVASFYIEGHWSNWVAAGLFTAAGITDYFDGYLARIWKVQSKLGQFLDPIADKLLVVTALMMLVHFNRADIIPALLILSREIFVSGLREFLGQLNISVPVSKLAKVKTGFQMLALFLLILGANGTGEEMTKHIGNGALWFAAILTLITGYAYLKAGLDYIASEDKK